MGTDGDGSVFHPRPDIRCPEVGKTGSRVSRLMNGKDGEDAYRNGLGVAYGSGGGSPRRAKAACWFDYGAASGAGDPPHLPERDLPGQSSPDSMRWRDESLKTTQDHSAQ